MPKTGKAYVIQHCCGLASPSFNKYCGVQEWKNDALLLWVNLGKKDDEIQNDFLENG
eukprot:CAMPEP_0202471380 /NCGR_PEP_ID=MMETSP1360-20130828/84515_1 /ASSEMBLY_ACC=CAM_ASM_000848 /TAXON_ID=515479 /ORGANISM="Licmophora paradoxa, Strain CCMP2313" /LENGTH=56 /DNA_ID=CAMNT_0049097447 /DNA_START=17 /DNA_END=184 /DNA_ORIENTATION=-